MAPPDDDIPDLFPRGRPAAPSPVAPSPAAPSPVAARPVVAHPASAVSSERRAASEPPRAFYDPEPRPSRPVPGPDSGLELEMIEMTPLPGGTATMIAGTSDELEFDLTSSPPPDFDTTSRSSRSPSARPPRADASLDGSISVPALRVPSLDVPSLGPTAPPAIAQKIVPPQAQGNPAERKARPSSALAAFPGLGNEVDLGDDLEDLDFGGAAAAQLNVAIPEREEGDDIPWPHGRTPAGDEFSVSAREAEQMSGFGAAPKGVLETPLYTWNVYRGLGALREKLSEAERNLREVEDARDESLAELANEKRAEIAKTDRFAPLYAAIDKHEQNIKLRKSDLEMVDVEGAEALREIQTEIDAFQAERLSKAKARDEKRALLSVAERAMKRSQAILKRIQIEWRNIEARAAKTEGTEMPDELAARLDVLEEQQVRARAELDQAIKQLKAVKQQVSDAENEVRIAFARVALAEGKKEGLLISYEGDIAERSRALDRALFETRQELAHAGRAILDLRGHVPVAPSVRSNLLAADERVLAAARQLEMVRAALGSMDRDAYGTGRAVWIAGLFVLLLVLAFVAL